jgi:hypothetical protein
MKRLAILCLIAGCGTPLTGSTLSGRVVVTGESALGGIAVTALGARALTVYTGADGSYTLDGLVDSRYAVSASVPSTLEGTVSVLAGAEGSGAVPDLVFTPVGQVQGRATRGGSAGGDAGIVITVDGSSAVVVTDDSGGYQLDAPTGTRSLTAVTMGFQPGRADGLDVRWKQTTEVPDIDLSASAGQASLSGVALLYGRSSHQGTTVTVTGTGRQATTAADGSWRIDGVQEGTYAVHFANGAFQETVPQVLAIAGSDGFVLDQTLFSLPQSPLTLYPATRRKSATLTTALYVLSPDGSRLVYTDPTTGALELVPLDGSAPQGKSAPVPVAQAVYQFGIAPAGNLVWYIGTDPATGASALLTVPVLGGKAVIIDSNLGFANVTWNADGTRLLYRTDLDAYDDAGTVKLAPSGGGAPLVIGSGASQPLVAADQRYALFVNGFDGNRFTGALVAVDLAAGTTATLSPGSVYIEGGFAFGAGDRVVFATLDDDFQPGPVYSVAPSGAGPVTLGAGGGLLVSGDGSTVAFGSCTSQAGCTSMVGPVGGPVHVAAPSAAPFALSRDGQQLVDGNGYAQPTVTLSVVPEAGGAPLAIAPAAYAEYSLFLVPDDAHVAYWDNVDGNAVGTLHVFSIPDGTSRVLADHAISYLRSSVAPDGKHLMVQQQLTAASSRLLAAAGFDGSPLVPLIDELAAAQWTPNGSLLGVRSGSAAPYRFQDGFYVYTP